MSQNNFVIYLHIVIFTESVRSELHVFPTNYNTINFRGNLGNEYDDAFIEKYPERLFNTC